MKGLVAVIGASAAALAIVAPGASGVPVSGPAVTPSQHVGGKSYAQWLTADWQFLLSHGHLRTEAPNQMLHCLSQGQHGKVWFLQDAYEGPTPVSVSCTIPGGRYLFLEGPGFECSTIEPAPYNAPRSRLAKCAASFKLKGLEVSVDGTPVTASGFEVATPVFKFGIPARGNVLRATGRTRGLGAAHADTLMLRPLTPGAHTIVQVEHFASGKSAQTIWQLTVH